MTAQIAFSPATPAKILIVPGLYGSGSEHWQSQWEKQHAEFSRVEQSNWNTPVCDDWVGSLDAAVRNENDNVILVGHSLGSVMIVHWASRYGRRIVGALLVAPSDTEASTFPQGTTGFSPIPACRLPFPSIVVASTDDPYISLERVTTLAKAWGSNLVSLGSRGHISVSDGFGPWPEGIQYIAELQNAAG
jgi:predicted alpha/beta hydrolase family esterase